MTSWDRTVPHGPVGSVEETISAEHIVITALGISLATIKLFLIVSDLKALIRIKGYTLRKSSLLI